MGNMFLTTKLSLNQQKKLVRGTFGGFTTKGEKIREELKDETAGTMRLGKLLTVIEKQEEKF